MRILVIGSGGREHALCWKIAQSTRCSKLYCAPGNGGTKEVAEPVEIAADDIPSLLKFAKDKRIDLTVVGPEIPLVKGIVDIFRKEALKIFGPAKELAAIEGSKVFSKALMKRCGVRSADYRVFDDFNKACEYAGSKKTPMVVKADGLCAGKGVVVCKNAAEAKAALHNMMVDRAFGGAADKVIVEDCLTGEEASIIVISDGNNFVPLASSQDHKRIFDGDRGPNTGGMGAYSPAPVITEALLAEILGTIIKPILRTLAKEGTPYKGALYAGIMVTSDGPYVLEFNARFGDPETQAILPRLKSDLVETIERSIDGELENYKLEWEARPCVSVVLASGGYPGKYENGMQITGLEDAKRLNDTVVFHAGTRSGRRESDTDNTVISAGGRVLDVTALGLGFNEAIENCYKAVDLIKFEGMHFRRDIGRRALKHLQGGVQ